MQTQSEPQHSSSHTQQPRTRRCRHIHAAGRQCGSPCLRTEHFCYFHHTTRRPVSDPKARRARATTYELPVPEDRDSIRAAIAQVMHDIANNHIDPRRAGLILYSLQLALCALPKEPAMPRIAHSISAAARPATRRAQRNSSPIIHIPAEPLVEETVLDDTFGLIAPETFLEPEEEDNDEWQDPGDAVLENGRLLRDTLGYKLLKDVELYESRTQGWYRGRVDAFSEAAKAAAGAADRGATAAELSETLAAAAAKAVAEQAAFTAQVAAKMATSPFYTGRHPDEDDEADNENAPAPELQPWESPILPNLNASAERGVFCHSRRESAFPAAESKGISVHAASAKVFRKCHPERSLARTCAKRSRRICGPLTPPQPLEPLSHASLSLYRTAPAIASSN